jgi:hypothetical protein
MPLEKSSLIKKLEEEGIITDVVTICPYCGSEATSFMWHQGCCGESSDHFVQGYLFSDDTILTEDQVNALYKSGSLH